MLPSAYEFHWDIGHIIFLGVFYSVVTTVLVLLGIAARNWLRDLNGSKAEDIEWEETFHDLPSDRRHCRHEFDGAVAHRICENGFACGNCPEHAELAKQARLAATDAPAPVGLNLSAGRLYHRGHTWVEPGPEGTWTIGLDEFAARCCGQPDLLNLPEPGEQVKAGERCVKLQRGSLAARFPSPIAGEVTEIGGPTDGWLYRVRPLGAAAGTEHLLSRDEARIWLMRELEWLQGRLGGADESADGMGLAADGGAPVDDLIAACPDADWDGIWSQVSLEV